MHIYIIPEVSNHAFILNVRHAFPYLEANSTVSSRFSKGRATSKGFVPLSDVDAHLQDKASTVTAWQMKSAYGWEKDVVFL